MNALQLVAAANYWMNNFGGPTLSFRSGRDRFYVGVTSRVKERLAEHNIDPDTDNCTWWTAESADAAHQAEAKLIELGCRGGTGGTSDPTTLYVYAITKTSVDH